MTGSGAVYAAFDLPVTPVSIQMKVYTASFRRILDMTWTTGLAAGHNRVQIPPGDLDGLANGTYYYVLIAVNDTGQTRSRVSQFLILR